MSNSGGNAPGLDPENYLWARCILGLDDPPLSNDSPDGSGSPP